MIRSYRYQGAQNTYLIAESIPVTVEAAGVRWTEVEAFPENKVRARFELFDALATWHLSRKHMWCSGRVPSSLHLDDLFGSRERLQTS
jgi:hypothetical protein